MDKYLQQLQRANLAVDAAPELSAKKMMKDLDRILARLDTELEASHLAMDKLLARLRQPA